ncbi:MAG TPA: DUF1015 family protein [Terracidiphilus sp.]|nr:DUF1015 family protein [Terracidiphilus sp.]
MASICPFRARRHNPSAVRLDDVLTQPADSIASATQQACYPRNPCNLVRLLRGLPEIFDADKGETVYSRAAQDFHAPPELGIEQGISVQQDSPCVFVCAQRFRPTLSALFRLHLLGGQAIYALD